MFDAAKASRVAAYYLVLLLAGASLTSCSSTRYADEADEIVEPPQQESAALEGMGAQTWCSDFGQPGLDTMVERAWSDNMQLKAAWARLEQAEAVARIESASLWPSAEANASAGYSNREFGGDGATEGDGAAFTWELSGAASYEIDLWGRHRSRANAAQLQAEAAEARARALVITLTSQVAEAWFDVVTHRERVELLERQLEVSENILEITRERLRRGLARAIDVAQQTQNVESLRGRLADARGRLETSRNRLAVLVGESAGQDVSVGGEAQLPDIEPLSNAGVPADLLERRPDVRAAFLRLEAADERTAAAVADQLPRLNLSAVLGFQGVQMASLVQQLFYSVGAGLTQPIFEGGRLRAEVDRSEAVAQEHLYNYANALLVAIREVRDALALESAQGERIESLEREIEHARSVLDLARELYRTGTADYLRILTGLEALQEVERSLLEARRQQVSHRIELCRALGGSWVEAVEPSINDQSEED